MTSEQHLILGWRVVHPDLRSSHGFRWPFPGQWAEAPGKCRPGGPCPSEPGDGLCIARTFRGAASGGTPAITGLLVAYAEGDVLGEDMDKVRVRRALVLDVIDIPAMIRRGQFRYANLRYADLRGADLRYADLRYADLRGANLGGADLRGAEASRGTVWPLGLDAAARGVVMVDG